MPFATVWEALANALILFLGMSVLYKKSIPYDIMEGLLLGTSTSMYLVIAANELWTSPISPLLAGDVQFLLPILFGLCFFFLMVPRLIFWYRLVLAITLTSILAIAWTNYITAAWGQVTGWTMLGSITDAILLIGVSITFAYMMFGRRLSGIMRPIGLLGPYFLYCCFGYMTVGQFYRYGAYAFPLFADLAQTPAIWLGVIAIAIILIDMKYPIAQALGISQAEEAV
jgi:hypothetical protein